jgi:hypothetical protein
MATRPTLMKRPDHADDALPPNQVRPTEERFVLRVDGQAKRSEPALTAGSAIKKRYSVVMVTALDTKTAALRSSKVLRVTDFQQLSCRWHQSFAQPCLH